MVPLTYVCIRVYHRLRSPHPKPIDVNFPIAMRFGWPRSKKGDDGLCYFQYLTIVCAVDKVNVALPVSVVGGLLESARSEGTAVPSDHTCALNPGPASYPSIPMICLFDSANSCHHFPEANKHLFNKGRRKHKPGIKKVLEFNLNSEYVYARLLYGFPLLFTSQFGYQSLWKLIFYVFSPVAPDSRRAQRSSWLINMTGDHWLVFRGLSCQRSVGPFLSSQHFS
jgi:hypothetical protein